MSWAAEVYAVDKRCAELCRDMSIAGFGFDRAEGQRLSATLLETERAARQRADDAVGRPIRRTKTGGFSTLDLHAAFFDDLGASPYLRSAITRKPSLKVDALRYYAANQRRDDSGVRLRDLALAVLEFRRLRKVRVTYIDNAPVGEDGRVHPSWLNYGAVSGRFSCQAPNLMNLPTQRTDPTIEWARDEATGRRYAARGGVRGLYRAKAGHTLVAFDAKQLEMRIAAYASGDSTMIAACQAKDLHAANAAVIFAAAWEAADAPLRESMRNLAKQSGFACCYLATWETVWQRLLAEGMNVPASQVKAMLRRLHREFAGYFGWQGQRLLDCIRLGYTTTPILGRRRWLGHSPLPTECANFPIQGGAADLMNLRLPAVDQALRLAIRGATAVAQVHDSGVFEVPINAADEAAAIMRAVFEAPIELRSGDGRRLEATFPIDVKSGERWK